jgi:hypothetical protein
MLKIKRFKSLLKALLEKLHGSTNRKVLLEPSTPGILELSLGESSTSSET